MHCAVLVRVDNCPDINTAKKIADDFAYRHSSDGVWSSVQVPLSPERFLNLLKDLEVDHGYDVEQLRLLLECGTDIKDLFDNYFEELFGSSLVFDLDTKVFGNTFKSEALSEIVLVDILTKNREVKRLYYNNCPEEIELLYDELNYKDGIITLRLTIGCGYEDWDYGLVEDEWAGFKSGQLEDVIDDIEREDSFYGYGIADEDYVLIEDGVPEGFLDDVNDKTYFIVLNIHI